MNRSLINSPTSTFIALMALMLLTRFHFDTLYHLPDASMAIFFAGGLILRQGHYFAGLMVLSVVIDALAINLFGVSGNCVTVAYAFMIPAYAILWGAGLWASSRQWTVSGIMAKPLRIIPLLTLILVSTWASYALSTLGFYGFSGYFANITWAGFWQQMSAYSPFALQSSMIYAILILLAQSFIQAISQGEKHGLLTNH